MDAREESCLVGARNCHESSCAWSKRSKSCRFMRSTIVLVRALRSSWQCLLRPLHHELVSSTLDTRHSSLDESIVNDDIDRSSLLSATVAMTCVLSCIQRLIPTRFHLISTSRTHARRNTTVDYCGGPRDGTHRPHSGSDASRLAELSGTSADPSILYVPSNPETRLLHTCHFEGSHLSYPEPAGQSIAQ